MCFEIPLQWSVHSRQTFTLKNLDPHVTLYRYHGRRKLFSAFTSIDALAAVSHSSQEKTDRFLLLVLLDLDVSTGFGQFTGQRTVTVDARNVGEVFLILKEFEDHLSSGDVWARHQYRCVAD